MTPTRRPLPAADGNTRPYWEGARRHELCLPYCARCGRYLSPVSIWCELCREETSAWRRVDGPGVIWSFCVTHIEVVSGYEPPYVVAVVEMRAAPGVKIVANIVGGSIDEVAIGKEVVLTFEDRGDISLPQFQLAAVESVS